MRVFQSTYKDRNGRTTCTKRWYVEFSDHQQTLHRLPGLSDKRQTEALGRRVCDLVNLKTAGLTLPPDVSKWIEGLPPRLHRLLGKWGLLDAGKVAALRPLAEHLEGAADAPGWRQYLEAKGNTAKHVDGICSRAKRLAEACKFRYWSDVSASRVMAYLRDLRTDKSDDRGNTTRGRSIQTSNFYLAAFRQFCKWMVKDGRASESPVAHLAGLNVKTDRRHDRRALSVEELRWLLDTTRNGPTRFGMTGPERAWLYRVATESGLRRGELASLTRASFTLDGERPTVRVAGAYSKRRREDELPLRADTAADLRDFLGCKLPGAQAFKMPSASRVANMIRADLEAARAVWLKDVTSGQERQKREGTSFLAYQDAAGRYADFHSLRHTAGSLLAASGVHPKVAQSIMRHSTIELTMSTYTHVFAGQETDAVAALPELGAAPVKQSARATATDGLAVTTDAPGCPRTNDHGQGRLLTRPQSPSRAEAVQEVAPDHAAESGYSVLPICLAQTGTVPCNSVQSNAVKDAQTRVDVKNENARLSEENRAFAGKNGEAGIRTQATGITP